jgi:hypothetical protein
LARDRKAAPQEVDTDQDRYPTLGEVVSRIQSESEFLNRQIEKLEINLQASGEATYRIFEPRAEESEGGYWPPPAS